MTTETFERMKADVIDAFLVIGLTQIMSPVVSGEIGDDGEIHAARSRL